ncbi:cingulin-like protein 1 isoform X2 [Narcine bancroftii]|uniref:cingulin-like protein 1 isoform X2 n=1 Tax=Narcine bancroftii TaxID=1343680 RepID=UPI0038311B90
MFGDNPMEPGIGVIQDRQRQRDYGIQIRFIQDAQEEGVGRAAHHPSDPNKSGSYGVSIRVQGIDGQPYVVLNSSQEGHVRMYEPPPQNGYFHQGGFNTYSGPGPYGRGQSNVPMNGHSTFPESQPFSPPYPQLAGAEKGDVKPRQLLNYQKHPEILKPYDPGECPPKRQSLACGKNGDVPKSELPEKMDVGRSGSVQEQSHLGRAPAQGDLAKKLVGPVGRTAPGRGPQASVDEPRPDLLPLRRQDSGGRVQEVCHPSSATSTPPDPKLTPSGKWWADDADEELSAGNVNRHANRRYIPFFPGTGRDIDSDHIPGVDELIDKFDGKGHRRSRSARRNRIDPEDRKRSRSADSAFPLKSPGGFTRPDGKSAPSSEHLLRPTQLRRQNALSASFSGGSPHAATPGPHDHCSAWPSASLGDLPGSDLQSQTEADGGATGEPFARHSALPAEASAEPEGKREGTAPSPQIKQCQAAPSFLGVSKKGQDPLTSRNLVGPVTPDLLKDQQTNEETAKQILYNYLKVGNQDDDATKKKVNLVFEKIQTLKSKSAISVENQKGNKDEKSPEFQALLEQKCALETNAVAIEKKAEDLQRKLDEVMMKQQREKEQKCRTKDDLKNLQQEMERSLGENNRLREQVAKSDKELRNQLEELVQVKMEREQYQSEIRDLQDQLSEMHDELDSAKFTADCEEKEGLIMEMIEVKHQLEEVLMAKEEQQEMLRRRERELTALRGVLKEEVSNHDRETEELKDQHEKEKQKLKKKIEDLMQSKGELEQENIDTKQTKNTAEDQVRHLLDEQESLKRKIDKLQAEVVELSQIIYNMKEEGKRQKDKVSRLEQDKKQLEDALTEVGDQEQDVSLAKRALQSQLEEVQRSLNKRSQEYEELNEKLQKETVQKDLMKKTKNEMEDEKRKLEKMVEKLQKEMAEMIKDSQRSSLDLRKELDECKEKGRNQLAAQQQQLKAKGLETEKSQLMTKKLQDEIRHLREKLAECSQERDEALLSSRQLRQNISELEQSLQSKTRCLDDRVRQVKQLEDKLADLEMELDEERNNADLLTDRVNRDREQHKNLRSRILHLEGSQKQNKEGIVAQLEARVQELEECLEIEDRERSTLQLNNRKLERKAKELMLQIDDEHLQLTDQKDQLNLRLKALKRQVDEAEEEVDRLENARRKLQRELEEQVEANEELQGQMNSLKKDLRRKNSAAKVSSSVLNDYDCYESTDEDSIYDSEFTPSREGHL